MQPRSLQQILTELAPSYNPQIKSIQQRQALIPQQVKTEETALGAKKDEAFGDILNGARRRGLGFSGIPLSEQAKYSATEYLPALARLRQSGQEQALSLQDALNQIYERRNTLAQQLHQGEIDRAEQARQFNENLALQREQMRRSAAASSASGNALASLFGSGSTNAPAKPQVDEGRAKNAVVSLLDTRNKGLIQKTIAAIQKSASRGNQYDQFKLKLIDSIPEFQKYTISNFNQLSF